VKKFIHEMTSEEAKEAIRNFYAKIPQEKLVKLAQEAGLLDEQFKGKVNIDAIYKRIDPFAC